MDPQTEVATAAAPPIDVPVAVRSEPLAPVRVQERIVVLDVLRGFALLGVFMVNMQFFAMPFMRGVLDPTVMESPWWERWSWALVKFGFEYKFVSLFSLLFGIGFTVQMLRAAERQRPFLGVYLRRTAVLFVIGLCHALLLWYGDILVIYSVIAIGLLLTRKLKPKTLIAIAAGLMVFSSVLGAAYATMGVMFQGMGSQQTPATVASDDSNDADSVAIKDGLPNSVFEFDGPDWDPNTAAWTHAEVNTYKHGPFLEAFTLRAVSYGYMLVFTIFGFSWHVLAMFLLGAGLMKLNFFSPRYVNWHWTLALIALPTGMLLEFVHVYGMWHANQAMDWYLVGTTVLHEWGSVLMMLGFVGVWCAIVQSGALRLATYALSCAGRMALTNYLMQSVTATFIMYWWGLGWFNDVTRAQQVGLVLGIYSIQLVISVVWMRLFDIGPLEWLWRSLTYLRVQPVRQRAHLEPPSGGEVVSVDQANSGS